MSQVFTIIVIFAILVFFFFIFYNQDSCKNIKQVHSFKNCIKSDSTIITTSKVHKDENCPSGTLTCPMYFGCNNDNIPMCSNLDEDGNYEFSCPTCEKGEWKCNFFMMGNGANGVPGAGKSVVDNSCNTGSDSTQDNLNCSFGLCVDLEEKCAWGAFNDSGNFSYTNQGTSDPNKVTGYKISSSGKTNLFKVSNGYDATNNLGGVIDTKENISLWKCIVNAKKSYKYNDTTYNGSFGFVYDKGTRSCDLHKIGDGVTIFNTPKYIKG